MTSPRIRIRPAGFDARPERPSSLRAQAQRMFRAAAEREETLRQQASLTPDRGPRRARAAGSPASPPPLHRAGAMGTPAGGGEHAVRGEMQTTALTQLVRALYEDSVVPVAEIARLAGVSWRTVYKYARKGDWRRRRAAQDVASAVAKRAAKRKRKPPPPFRTLQGAGGRFIRSADAEKPVRRGLKALDPPGEARALALCRRAEALSDGAVSRTQAMREAMREARTMALLVQVVRDIAAVEDAANRDSAIRDQADSTPPGAAEGESEVDAMRRALYVKLEAWMRGEVQQEPR